jgi:hypothetical protein
VGKQDGGVTVAYAGVIFIPSWINGNPNDGSPIDCILVNIATKANMQLGRTVEVDAAMKLS